MEDLIKELREAVNRRAELTGYKRYMSHLKIWELAWRAAEALQQSQERKTRRCKLCFEMKEFYISGESAKFCPICGRELKT
jgi:rubrerythrin